MKRLCGILSLLILLTICVILLPTEAQAAEIVDSGTCGAGDSLTWTLDNEGTLTISGAGVMWGYGTYNYPWSDVADSIKCVVIESGVTNIGGYAFYECSNLVSISISNSVNTIDIGAFENCSSLNSVTIPDSVTSIDDNAFRNCTGLTSLTIGDSVTSIGNSAFENCSSLNSVTIPDSVNTIDDSAFENCSSLTSITIPDSVTTIKGYAFSGCKGLTTINYNATLASAGHNVFLRAGQNGSGITLNIGEKVTTIQKDLFAGGSSSSNPKIVTVNFSENSICESIQSEAFYCLSSLMSIRLPESVISIGSSAFYGCTSLTSIHIPENVTTITDSAFGMCTALVTVTGGTNVQEIGARAFLRTPWDNTTDKQQEGIRYIGKVAYDYVGDCPAVVTLRDDTTQIYKAAFSDCSNLTKISIPDSVTSIGDSAFNGCSKLESIKIPAGVTAIGDRTFWQCSSLTTISIPDSVTRIGDEVFFECRSLTSVRIPEGTSSVGYRVFSGCYNLTTVTLPKSVTRIEESAFANCGKLECINIPDGVTEIESSTFAGCEKLESVTGGENVTSIGYRAFYQCSSLAAFSVPEGVTSIGDSAFYLCPLSYVNIPAGLTQIGDNAFTVSGSFCVDSKNKLYSSDDRGVLFDKEKTTLLCTPTALSGYYMIPESVHTIKGSAFYQNNGLTEVVISNNVTTIGERAFQGCTALTKLTIGEGVKTIDKWAFNSCSYLTEIYFNAVNMEGYAIEAWDANLRFRGAGANGTGVTVIVGEKVTQIPESLFADTQFSGDGKINSVIFKGNNVTIIGANAFRHCNLTKVVLPEGLTHIESGAFAYMGSCQFTIPASLKYIGANAFTPDYARRVTFCVSDPSAWCKINYEARPSSSYITVCVLDKDGNELTDIALDDTVTTIPDCAFYNSNISSIRIPDSIKTIGTNAFAGCSQSLEISVTDASAWCRVACECDLSLVGAVRIIDKNGNPLSRIVLDSTVTAVPAYAFKNAQHIKSVIIYDTVTDIGTGAFYQSSTIQEVYYTGSRDQWEEMVIGNSNSYLTSATLCCDMRYVTFKNWNGALLGEKMLQQGETITFDSVPEKTADNTYTYTFSGWDQTVCTGDMEVTAQYTATYIDYTVSFYDWDGTSLQSKTYHWGDPITVPTDLTKAYDETYYYVFDGWDASVSTTCDGNKTYTAVYEAKARTAAATPTAPVVLDYTPAKVTLEPTEGYEYSMDGTNWQDSNSFIGLKADTQYTFYQRVKETETTFASQTSPVLNFKTAPKAACSVKPVAPIVADYTYNKIVLVSREGYEYRLNNGAWTTNPTFTGLSADTTYTVYQRITETAEEFTSDASRGVTVKTAASPTGKTSASRYEQLRQYISAHATSSNGKVLLITQSQSSANYTYRLTNQNEGITFSMTSEHKGSSGFDIMTHFTLYPNSKNINVSCTVSYFSGGKVMDMAVDTISVNRSTYTVNTKLYSSESGFLYITSGDFSGLATTSMGVLCTYWNAHILSNLGFDLEDLGFVSFVNNSPSVCDIPSGYHAGTLVLRNQREAGCLIDGYTGDHYCSACGEKVKIGNAIACVGMHSYDNNCDNTCNACGEERIVTHTYTSGCDEKCDICNHARIAPADHTFDTDGVCTVCGALDRIPGDIDGNDAVTQDDAVYLLLHTMFGEAFYPLNGAEGDIDGSGSVDQEDAVYLLLHTMFGDTFYPLNTPALPAKTKE